jgi:hypothetical protein
MHSNYRLQPHPHIVIVLVYVYPGNVQFLEEYHRIVYIPWSTLHRDQECN